MSNAILEHEVLREMNPDDPDVRVGDVYRHRLPWVDSSYYEEVIVTSISYEEGRGWTAGLHNPRNLSTHLQRGQRVDYMTADMGWELVERKE